MKTLGRYQGFWVGFAMIWSPKARCFFFTCWSVCHHEFILMFVTLFLSCVQLPESFPKFSELQCRHQVCKQNRLPCLWSFCFQGLKAWEALHFLHLALSLEVTSELEPHRMASLWFDLLFSPFCCFQIKQDLLVVFAVSPAFLTLCSYMTGFLCSKPFVSSLASSA